MAVPRTRILRSIVTTSGADAFTQLEIQTGLFASETEGLMIRRIQLQDATLVNSLTTPWQKNLAISRRSKSAVPDITDVDCIFRWDFTRDYIQATAAAIAIAERPRIYEWRFPDDHLDNLIVEDPLYALIDSNAVTTTITINLRLECEVVKLTQIERLSLLQRNT